MPGPRVGMPCRRPGTSNGEAPARRSGARRNLAPELRSFHRARDAGRALLPGAVEARIQRSVRTGPGVPDLPGRGESGAQPRIPDYPDGNGNRHPGKYPQPSGSHPGLAGTPGHLQGKGTGRDRAAGA